MPVWAYLVAVPVFGLLILVHELGHYLAARSCGIAVAEFSIGFGPRLYSFTRLQTEWTLRAIPLGGYVRWHDEGPGAFAGATLGARAWALAAGPLANLGLTALLIMLIRGLLWEEGLAALPRALSGTFLMAGAWIQAVLDLFRGSGIEQLAGPVGIAQVTAEAAFGGMEQLLVLAAVLSLNIGLFNLLPFPGLDGARLSFLALERVRRRPLDAHVEGWIHVAGFLILFVLMIFTAVRDLIA